jgi:hypothetical protein
MLLYLPPYSPDLNPIEESFSTCEFFLQFFWVIGSVVLIGKAYLRCNAFFIQQAEDPILALLESCVCITADMARGWFRHAGYIVTE